ncbi:MAG: hypothetical protein V3S08_10870, partial [Phycisphaerales bacterium]
MLNAVTRMAVLVSAASLTGALAQEQLDPITYSSIARTAMHLQLVVVGASAPAHALWYWRST